MKVAIVKYNAGNIRSVTFCLKRLGVEALLTDDAEELMKADKVIFPGVGEASSAMQYLSERGLDKVIPALKQPVLGICLGMQLMCSHSEEGNTVCLGIFEERVMEFKVQSTKHALSLVEGFKVPHMGWNNIFNLKSELFNGVKENEFLYFVHSYYVETGKDTYAVTNYGIDFASAIGKNNFYGVQFHSEKSADAGENIMENFLKL